MKQINIFFSVIILFALVLTGLSLVFILSTKLYSDFADTVRNINQVWPFILDIFKASYMFFLIAALFLTFIIYYSFVNIKTFKDKNYILTVIFTPLVISVFFYLEIYYPQVLGLAVKLGSVKNLLIQNDPAFKTWQLFIFEPKMYYFSFLIFIIIPVCLTLNNQNWYLKTLIFLFILIPAVLFLFKYYNQICMKLLKNVKNYPGFPKTVDMILSLSYLPFGWYLFKIADSIRNIKMRIDLGKVRKIHH